MSVAVFFTGCGECVFSQELTGVVVDQDGNPLSGAELTTCHGEQCAHDPASDDGCVSSTTSADGRFSLEVGQCRPAAFQCELRPVEVTHADCETVVEQLPLTTEDVELTLDCL